MMHGITIGLFLFSIYSIQGYLYLVKSSTENVGVCYTDETDRAVAYIPELKHDFNAGGDIADVNYASISRPKNVHENDCNMFHRCDKWTKNDFSEFSSIDSTFPLPPLMDQRWNYLNSTTITTKFTTKELFNLNGSLKGFFFISILAHDSAQIVISQEENFKSGYQVVLGGWANSTNSKSRIRYSPEIPTNTYPSIVTTYSERIHNNQLLKNGTEWLLILLRFEVKQKHIILNVDANGEPILKAAINDHNLSLTLPWRIGVRTNSYYSAQYKLHNYKVLKPLRRDVTMHTTVDISQDQPSICLEITYYIFKWATNEPITIQIVKLSGNGREKKFTLKNQQDYHWIKQRKETALPGAGQYNISITIAPHAVFIGDISFCKKTVYVTPFYKSLTDCKFLDGYKPIRLDVAKNDALKLSAVCDTLGSKNCSFVEYCDKNRCECSSEDIIGQKSKRCTKECNKGFYNYKCNKPTCNGGAYLIHTDICIDGCTLGFRSPKCNKKLLRFKISPNVTTIRAKTCVIDLSEAYNDLDINYNKSELNKWNYTEIQLLKGEIWETVTKLHNHNQSTVVLENLTPMTVYRVRALIVETDGQHTTHNLVENSFKKHCLAFLEINISMHNHEEEYLCDFHRIGIDCGQNSSLSISYDDIVHGKAKKLKMEDIDCNITVYTRDGIAISLMRHMRHITPIISICGLIKIANLMATILINILTVFLFTRRMNTSKNTNTKQHCVTYSSSNQEAVDVMYYEIGS